MKNLKIILFKAARLLGLFRLAAWITRKKLRILCYHGYSVSDEHNWDPWVFMTPELMHERFRHVKESGYSVILLGDAVRRLREGTLPDRSVVITFDDGFATTLHEGVKMLLEYSFPATFYVTSYYVLHQHPIFRLAVQYSFWKTSRGTLALGELAIGKAGIVSLDEPARNRAMWEIIEEGERNRDNAQRDMLIRRLGRALGVDAEPIFADRRFHLLTTDEILACVKSGFDVQLHMHNHQFPDDPEKLRSEIVQNREILEPLAGKKLTHLCYPSGAYRRDRWPQLAEMGIESATTCEPGLNTADTPALGLKRQLDSQIITQVEFEAELSGFVELLRRR